MNQNYEDLDKKKKIKEITVDLSPKKKLNLINNNQNLNRRFKNIQNGQITNYNLSSNPNSKIESCIITFDKNQKNLQKNKISSSLDRYTPSNKIRYIKKKVMISNIHKNIHEEKETPGFNLYDNDSINKNGSVSKILSKPGGDNLSRSIGRTLDNLEISGEVKDYCAPSPDYGKKGKEAFLNSQKNRNKILNNNSPYLSSSGKFQIFDSNQKDKDKDINKYRDNASPFKNTKYNEFSFKENDDNNLNNKNIIEANYSNGQKIEINIFNHEDNNINIINNKNKSNDNFSIFKQQRMPTFSNIELVNKNEEKNTKDINKENNLAKLIIKSFSNKKKEIKEKPKLYYTFYKKYYDIYLKIPQKENIYMTKSSSISNKKLKPENNKSNEKIEKKYFDKKLINAPVRGKRMDSSAQYFFARNKINSSLNEANYSNNYNNTIDIELEDDNDNINKITSKKNNNNNKLVIKAVIKKIKPKQKKELLKKLNNNNIAKKINVKLLKKEIIKTKEQIKREKKVILILKEDFENYIIYYEGKINNNKKKKYDWSMVELLIIKVKLDIGDIIQGYLKACEDIINNNDLIIIGNDYINNIIQHYKNNYLTNKNFEEIRIKILKIFIGMKDINIELDFKYNILSGLMSNLIDNELLYRNDFDILKQCDEENKNEIKKILENYNDKEMMDKIKN